MLTLAPAIWALNERYRREMAQRLRKVQETWSRLSSTLAESVGGIRVTQAFVRQDINADFFRKLVTAHGENNVGLARATAVFVPLLQLKSQLFLGGDGAGGGVRGAAVARVDAHGGGGPGDVFLFGEFVFEPVQNIGNQYNQALTAMAGGGTVFPAAGPGAGVAGRGGGAAAGAHRGAGGIPGGAFRV